MTGFGPMVSRSSRYSVMSRAPRGTARLPVRFDQLADALGELHAPALDPDQHQVIGPVRQIHDRCRHMLKRPRQGAGVEDGAAVWPRHLGVQS